MNRELQERAYRALSMTFGLLADVQAVSPGCEDNLVAVERELLELLPILRQALEQPAPVLRLVGSQRSQGATDS
jgi:hypothetical protein